MKKIAHLSLRSIRTDSAWLFAPLAVFLLTLYFTPVLRLLSTSFTDGHTFWSEYAKFFSNFIYINVLLRTLFLAATVTLATCIIGYPFAYTLTLLSPRSTKIMLFLVFLPFWTNIIIRTYGLMVIFGRDGIINNMLIEAHILRHPITFMFNGWMVRGAMIEILLPIFIMPLFSVLRQIDLNLTQAAQGLGARPLSAFLRIYLPLSIPGVIAGSLIVFVLSLGFFVTPAFLGGRHDVVISMLILNQFEAQLNWGFGAALATIVMSVAGVALLLLGIANASRTRATRR